MQIDTNLIIQEYHIHPRNTISRVLNNKNARVIPYISFSETNETKRKKREQEEG